MTKRPEANENDGKHGNDENHDSHASHQSHSCKRPLTIATDHAHSHPVHATYSDPANPPGAVMKSDWPVSAVGEHCVLRPPKSEARARLAVDARVSFLPMEDLGIDVKYPTPTKARKLAEVAGSYTYFADGDVLLAKITPCFQNGKLGIASGLCNGVGFGSSEFFVLRPCDKLDREYLYYFLSRDDFRQEGVQRMGGSVGQQRVPPEFLRGKGWTDGRLGDLVESISTGPFGTMLHKSDYVPDGIPLVNPMNIVDSRIVPSDRMLVSKETRARLQRYILRAGDVVIGRRGEMGRCALVTENESGWLCGTGSFFLRLSDRLNGKFFVALFGSKGFKAKLEAGSVGTTMSNLNHTILETLPIPLPPLAMQHAIIEQAEEIEASVQRLESIYNQKLAALDELKKSLLHQAFSGQL